MVSRIKARSHWRGWAFLLAAGCAVCARGQEIDRDHLIAELRSRWDSIASIEWTSNEVITGVNGDPGVHQRFEFAMEKPGKYALKAYIVTDGEEKPFQDIREDGRKRYQVNPIATDASVIESVSVTNQKSTASSYQGMMFGSMTAFMPGGKSAYQMIIDGAAISQSDDDKDCIILTAEVRGASVRCEIVPGRDYLVRHVQTTRNGKPTGEMRVVTFDVKNGRWFPMEGRGWGLAPKPDGTHERYERSYKVSRLAMNLAIDPARFSMPQVPDGTRLHDLTTDTTTYQGGAEARKKFLVRYVASAVKSKESTKPIRVPKPVSGENGALNMLAIGAGAGGIALLALAIRRRRLS